MAKKVKKTITQGMAHIHSTYQNTIVSFSDLKGNVFAWSSSGVFFLVPLYPIAPDEDHAKTFPLRSEKDTIVFW